jgi:hypothetical protein
MPVIMRLIGWADGRECPGAGKFIRTVDIQQAPMSAEWITVTADPAKARLWPSVGDAMQTYREVLKSEPVRADGKPNRPLTALTVVIEQLEEAWPL